MVFCVRPIVQAYVHDLVETVDGTPRVRAARVSHEQVRLRTPCSMDGFTIVFPTPANCSRAWTDMFPMF